MARRLLLIGWEAADWKILHPLIDAGEMPVLRRMVEAGPSGQLLCTQPMISIAQWGTILTGKRPWQHGTCHPIGGVNHSGEMVSTTAASRRSLALWEILAKSEKRSIIVGLPATHGEQCAKTIIVSDHFARPTAGPGIRPWPPAAPGTYWPAELGERLDCWRMSPAEVQADIISLCVPGWRQIDQKRDRRLGKLRLFLAADFSHQAAAMTLLTANDWDFAAVHFPALGAISQIFLPYHFPPAGGVDELEFKLYGEVIRGACRLLDQMLGNLVRAAGENARVIVVSGHGVTAATETLRARPGADEAPHGIFAASGSGFTRDSLVFGATVLDIAPTLLASLGLAVGDDMEGRVLLECFEDAPEIAHVPSWEADCATAASSTNGKPTTSENSPAKIRIERETDWNLAQSFLEAGRLEEAFPILNRLFRNFPERTELAMALFQCQLTLKKIEEATETLQVLMEGLSGRIWPLLLRAELSLARGQFATAREMANQACALKPQSPDALRRLGMLWLRLRDWNALEHLARQSLKLDDNDALAWLGLAEAQLRKRLPVEAEAAATRAIGLNFYLSNAHFVLARALVAQGKWQQAHSPLQTYLKLQPNNRAAASYAKRMERQVRASNG